MMNERVFGDFALGGSSYDSRVRIPGAIQRHPEVQDGGK